MSRQRRSEASPRRSGGGFGSFVAALAGRARRAVAEKQRDGRDQQRARSRRQERKPAYECVLVPSGTESLGTPGLV